MVVHVEERVCAAASPSLAGDGRRLGAAAALDGARVLFLALDALLVVLREAPAPPPSAVAASARAEQRRSSQLELWQVWDARERIACVRANTTSSRVARGAVALVLDEGHVALLTPSTASLPTAAPTPTLTRTASRLTIKTSESELKPVAAAARRTSVFGARSATGSQGDVTPEYRKLHLHLQRPTWQESFRWKADDDRFVDRIEWVEAGDDLWLVGAGEKVTTWKIVEESGVVAYQQLSFAIGEPDQRAWHMDVTQTGRFAATAGLHDRVLKLWSLQELALDGTPVCSFLPHRRALVSVTCAKPCHAFKIQGSTAGQCEMLYTLDRAGTVSIWRENVASPNRGFTLWKTLTAQDAQQRSTWGEDGTEPEFSPLKSWTLVVNNWGREPPRPLTAFSEALLEESNVMSALSQFHYGYTSLDEVRRNELLNQRMDNVPKANSKLLGGRTGMVADSHAGEAFIAGNMPLNKTFLVHLGLGVQANGDLSLFRIESVPYSGVSPRTSLLCLFSGLREQFLNATVYSACTTDYKDRENGSSSFLLEILFQPRVDESHLKFARLKFQVENSGLRSARTRVSYSVQMCEVGDASPGLMSSNDLSEPYSSLTLKHATNTTGSGHALTVHHGAEVDILRAGSLLRELKVTHRTASSLPSRSLRPSHIVQWSDHNIIFAFADGKLHGSSLGIDSPPPIAGVATGSKALFSDDEAEAEGIVQLIMCGVSPSQKKVWSSAPTNIFFAMAATETPTILKDFCVVVGLKPNLKSLIVWVFSMEPPTSPNDVEVSVELASTCPLKLFRRVIVEVPDNQRLLQIAPTPSLDDYETLFVGVTENPHSLSLWSFADMDELSGIERAHTTDLSSMLKSVSSADSAGTVQDTMRFSFTETKHEFQYLSVSDCGRVSLLFAESINEESSSGVSSTSQVGGDFTICIVSLFDSWHESVVRLPRKKFGQLIAMKWTPPLAPSLDCQIVLLTATAIGIIRIDETTSDSSWNLSWMSSRLTVKPQALSDLTRFPQLYLSLGGAIADLNVEDLGGLNTPSMISAPAATVVLPTSDVASSVAHPISLLFLLMRGSFTSLDHVVKHIKESIIEHEKTCYLKMIEDQELRKLPFMKLVNLLGKHCDKGDEDDKDERSITFTKGKTTSSGYAQTVQPRASLARASDLFAMDFGSVRRSSLALGLSAGEAVFGSSQVATSVTPSEEILELESVDISSFFQEHQSSLSFLTDNLRSIFTNIIAGSRKIVAWEKDSTRMKDEPTLRFAASLLWPYKSPFVEATPEPEGGEIGDEGASIDLEEPLNSVRGICSEQVAWAALSDYQAEILQECFPSLAFTMEDLSQLRLPFWLKSSVKLTQLTEKAAQAEYASSRDPFRVALLYVLLGKTKLLSSLFKMGNESKIADLLANDFNDPRWKNAAVKNAYVLKAKRRHELSAAFFLLGGKVQEAMAVAEHADPSLVLSFLIARLSEKWDLGGTDGQSDSFGGGYPEISLNGLSSNMRGLGSADSGVTCKDLCKEYLKTTVWSKAQARGDVYMAFLVKYLIGETIASLQTLLTVPSVDVLCMFDAPFATSALSNEPTRELYWRVFGQSLLGAADLVRYLRPTIPRMTSLMKVQAVHLQTIALNRLFAMGCNIPALYQQRDCATQFKQLCKDKPPQSSAVRAAFLAVRRRILTSVISGQSEVLSSVVVKSLDRALGTKAGTPITMVLEESIDDEIRCLLSRGGHFAVDDLPETQTEAIESELRKTVLRTLRQAGRTPVEDFLHFHWNLSSFGANGAGATPLQTLLEVTIDGIAKVAGGNLVASATIPFHSKHIDQISAQLLGVAEKLLSWLAYLLYGKRPSSSSSSGNSDFIRVVTASVYSIICVCIRYVKSPCCTHRALTAIFPHIESLPKKTLDDIKEIGLADVCVHCSAAKNVKEELPATGVSSLQRDIPVLYQIVRMLRENLNIVVEEVRTGRLELSPPMSFYSYCQYWTLVLCIASSVMPGHVSKVSVDGANPHSASTILAKKLVQTWSTYSTNLSKYSSRMLLCELMESYFRPYTAKAPLTPAGSTPGTPKEALGSGVATGSSPSNNPPPTPVLSPLGRDRRESRQLLRCTCDRCPWLLIVKMFADKDELLLRINSQLECCSEKIKEEISWGHLPDFPSKKAALTRSQKILLSNAAAGKTPELSDLIEKKILQGTPSIQLDAHCIYRSDVSIKSLCFNRATETAELVLCSSKGICRTASVEYSDGTKYQFKGMYAYPQSTFGSDNAGPAARRKTADVSTLLPLSIESPQRGGGGGSEMKTPSFKPTAVESHPFLPLFVSGTQKGKVHLWSYESLSAVCEFQTSDVVATYPLGQASSSRRDIKKLRFDNLGQQMGAVDSLGRLSMWRFANLDRQPCYRVIDCHDKGAKSLQFVNSSSIVATAGSSSDKRSVCMWDLLLPNSKAQIAAPTCHPAGAASLTFSPTHQLLISGGEGGSISVFDVRQRRVLHTITNAHETAITTLELHPSGRCVLSGSASGDVKIWSLPIFRELVAVSKVHAKPSFLGDAASNLLGDAASNMAINVTSSSWGVTDAFATDAYFFTSGTDGSVQRFRVPSLGNL